MNESNQSSEALAELLTLTVVVDERGNTKYRNHLGQLHRVHGPAAIYTNGDQYWMQHDRYHRTDGPAIVTDNGGEQWWFISGKRHRDDGAAVIFSNGTQWWFQHGQRHRTDGPAVVYWNDTKEWYWYGAGLSEQEYNERIGSIK